MEASRYVIMANGRGRRWGNYLGKPKQLIEVGGETLLQRTTKLVHQADPTAEVFITSSFSTSEAEGATRHVPLRADYELDRFCYELICPHMCFLYGDTFYTNNTIETIVKTVAEPIAFFGNNKSIVAIKSNDDSFFKSLIDSLFLQIKQGEIIDAKGWDLYRLASSKLPESVCTNLFIRTDDSTQDFNLPEDYLYFISHTAK